MTQTIDFDSATIGIIGLGYVGLPLAVAFGKIRKVVGFDTNPGRVAELQQGRDSTLEVPAQELNTAHHLSFTNDPQSLTICQIFIVTVPTPVDKAKRPDMTPLMKASETVGKFMPAGSIVIFESTVYPGATEEICAPLLEQYSGQVFNRDFFCGYSPERINPGDKEHRLTSIRKITSGSTESAAETVDNLYRQIITAGTHKTRSIRVAEAAKVIENTQRDVNIALMNELSLIFKKMNIDTLEVLDAAGTKWNFMPFRPGLVGGHCIGVDPYYLTHKAQELGYHPEVILAGRRINDSMAGHVADQVVKLMLRKNLPVLNSKVLVLGLTFKENCPDLRNTKVVDLVTALQSFNAKVDVYDPWIDQAEAHSEYGLNCLDSLPGHGCYDAIVVAVGHQQFKEMGPENIRRMNTNGGVLFDVKSMFPIDMTDGRL